ncbi:hypothetical protein IGI37_002798 [Enterococcus sp. AZ194]|uniref:hypothetical protein n=1 Tax=Enterococcus sp. AZ194 TaxID=2774629 RepID=UPI003F29DDA1
MIIDGKEIVFFSKKKEVPAKYYQILERVIVSELKALVFVERVKVRQAKRTNSLYFETRVKGVEEALTVSVRSHFPLETREDYLYILLPHYKVMSEVIEDIRKEMTTLYNQKADAADKTKYLCPEERRLMQEDLADKKKPKKRKHNLPNKSKGTRTDFKRAQLSSYEDFLKEFKENESKP